MTASLTIRTPNVAARSFFACLFLLILIWPVANAQRSHPVETLGSFLDYWKAGEYSKMYELLSSASRLSISRWDFLHRLEDAEGEFRIIDFSIYDCNIDGDWAVLEYSLTIKRLFGDQITERKTIILRREHRHWKVELDSEQEGLGLIPIVKG